MAYKETIKVISSKIETLKSKFEAGKTYNKLIIVGQKPYTGDEASLRLHEYETTNPELVRIYEKGEKLDLTVETVGKINRILNLKEVNMVQKFVKKQTTTEDTTTEQELKYIRIKGTLFYSKLREPDTKGMYPTGKYTLQLGIGETTKEKLEDLGVKVKHGETQGDYVDVRSKKQPAVIASTGERFVEVPLVGNGSTAIVTAGIYDNRESNVKAGKGGAKCLSLVQVELINHIPYEAKEAPLLGEDD